jgi:hypothetical protein
MSPQMLASPRPGSRPRPRWESGLCAQGKYPRAAAARGFPSGVELVWDRAPRAPGNLHTLWSVPGWVEGRREGWSELGLTPTAGP